MFKILRHYGIPEETVQATKALYDNSRSAVYVDGHRTKEFNVTTGVLQGDVLAPFLFIIMIDYSGGGGGGGREHGFTTMPRRSTRHPGEVINDLDFADDIVLLESSL